MKLNTYSIRQIKKGMHVIMRVDGDVAVENGKVADPNSRRLNAFLPELRALLKRGAKVILIMHVGRPGGKRDEKYSTKPIASFLSEKLGKDRVLYLSYIGGLPAQKAVDRAENGTVIVLENMRFHKGEKENSGEFARSLAVIGDIYINNAFANSHRKHASMHAITRHIDSYAGKVVEKEVTELSKPYQHPSVLIVGGIKLETKVPIIEHLGNRVDKILTAGGVAVALLSVGRKTGLYAGTTKVSKEDLVEAKKIVDRFGDKVHVPIDFQTKSSASTKTVKIKKVEDITGRDRLFDIGPRTVKHYRELLKGAKTIVWNGPMGQVEVSPFGKGTYGLAKAIVEQRGARKVVGGGDTLDYLDKKNLLSKFDFVSTGGGAMLEFLSGDHLPGLKGLRKRSRR